MRQLNLLITSQPLKKYQRALAHGAAALTLAIAAHVPAQAFCGFYAGKADANLFNEASWCWQRAEADRFPTGGWRWGDR